MAAPAPAAPPSPAELVAAACAVGPPEWGAALAAHGAASFTVEPVYGGMSNLIFRLTRTPPAGGEDEAALAPPPLRRMMARVLSPQLDDVIDRALEARVVAWISAHPSHIGPRLFGSVTLPPRHAGGVAASVRFEECIDGRTLAVADLRHGDAWLVGRIARKMALLHAAPPPWAAPPAAASAREGPLDRYLQCVRALRAHPRIRAPELAAVARLLDALPWDAEAAWLARRMAARGGPTVLTHGDNQAGNWILEGAAAGPAATGADGGDVVLIDYEYSRLDARGFDLGNLLCEATFDYTRTEPPGYAFDAAAYPSPAWQAAFLRAYANADAEARGVSPAELCGGSGGGGGDTAVVPPPTSCAPAALAALPRPLRPLAAEARLGILASHLYWALWGTVMAAGKLGVRGGSAGESSGVATGHSVFDYCHYGAARAAEFARLKLLYDGDVPEG